MIDKVRERTIRVTKDVYVNLEVPQARTEVRDSSPRRCVRAALRRNIIHGLSGRFGGSCRGRSEASYSEREIQGMGALRAYS